MVFFIIVLHIFINPRIFVADPLENSANQVIEGTDLSPENWYSVEMEVNSNGNIIDGINHCYAFGKINNETIFSDNDFPCPTFSNNYGNISHDNALPYLGGGDSGKNAMVRIRRFEWLEEITQTTTAATTTLGN